MNPQIKITLEPTGDLTVVRFVDREQSKYLGDEDCLNSLVAEMFAAVDSERPNLLVDCANMKSIVSAALGKFITLNKKLQKAGGHLAFCNMNKDVYIVFELTNLHKIFKIQRAEEAVADPRQEATKGTKEEVQPEKRENS